MMKRMLSYVVLAGFGVTMLAACGTPAEKDAGHELVTRVPVTYEAPAQPTEGATDGDGGAAASVVLQVMDIYFAPADFTIASGATLILDASAAMAPHNFEVAALGIDIDLAAGEIKEIVIDAAPGVYDYICNVPGHKEAGMVGKMTVTEAAAGAPTADAGPADAAAGPANASIKVMDIYFDPADFSIGAGGTLTLDASGAAAPHNFEVAALGIDVDIAPGEVKDIVIEGAPGTYDYICNVPGHKEAGMVGKMTITEGGAAAGEVTMTTAAEATTDATAEAALEPLPTAFTIATVDDEKFDPRDLTIPANVEVTLTVDNTAGTSMHNLTIAELKVDVDVAAGAKMDVVVVAPVGRYEFSSAEGMDKMRGMLGVIQAVDAPALAAAITIEALDIYFDPATAEIPANTPTTIVIDATGAAAPHNFAIDALGIDVDVAAGQKVEVVIDAPAGTYDFYCNVPGHKEAGMVGVLTVK